MNIYSIVHTVSSSSCSSSWVSTHSSSASSSSFNSFLFLAPAFILSGSESKLKVKKLYASSAEGKSFWN